MSVGQMSATLQNKIAESLEKAMTDNGRIAFNVRNHKSFIDFTSASQIRTDTNSIEGKHESIMSRGALEKLKADLRAYSKQSELVAITDSIIDKLNLDSFIDFILSKNALAGNALKKSSARSDPNFEYTAPVKLGAKGTRLIKGTNTVGDSNRDVLILKNIPHGNLVSLFVEYVTENVDITGINKGTFIKELKELFNAGHLTGVFTSRLVRTFGVRNKDNSFTVASGHEEVAKLVQAAIDLATTADLLSSNIYDDPELFLRTDKRLYDSATELRLTTEVQFAKGNQDVGKMLAQAGNALSSAIKAVQPGAMPSSYASSVGKAVKSLFNNLNTINGYISDRIRELESTPSVDPKVQQVLANAMNTQKVFEELISSKGSDSIVDHIVNSTIKAIDPKAKVNKSNTTASARRKVSSVNTKPSKPKKVALTSKAKAIAVKIRELKTPAQHGTADLVMLQAILDAELVRTVKANMGDGSRSDILNLRSGRFAESVSVEKLSESRAGMITAFYTYMKYPYATFSQGGKQSVPKSRDPKILISKSIRELLQSRVSNRLRAVLV